MKKRELKCAGYILRKSSFRESSVRAEIFTQSYGMVHAVIKSAKRNKTKPPLHIFKKYYFSWSGGGDLKAVYAWEETTAPTLPITGIPYSLYYQLQYVNELLLSLLQVNDPYPLLFTQYENILDFNTLFLRSKSPGFLLEIELEVLSSVGYGINLAQEGTSTVSIVPTKSYQWVDGTGFVAVPPESNVPAVDGATINALAAGRFDCLRAEQISRMRKITRQVIITHCSKERFLSYDSYVSDASIKSS